MKKNICVFLSSCWIGVVSLLPHATWAEIYKKVDAEGKISYSNTQTEGALALGIVPFPPPNTTHKISPKPTHFPNIDKNTQNQRDAKRRAILQAELISEERALQTTKRAYAENKTDSSLQGQSALKNLQADWSNHQKNIQLLQKELRTLPSPTTP